jgi:hypothetical protein
MTAPMIAAPDRDDTVVDRFAITWQAAPDLDHHRLDRLVQLLLDGALEDALDDVGVGRDGELCVRAVDVAPHAFRWSQTDDDVVAGWSRSIALAVHEAVTSGAAGEGIVRYRTRAEAVVDLVDRVAVGDVRRSWAWAQLGLWPVDEEHSPSDAWIGAHLASIFRTHPALVVPALTSAARRGRWPALVTLVGWDGLATPARAAWQLAGGAAVDHGTGAPPSGSAAHQVAAALAPRSHLARAAGGAFVSGRPGGAGALVGAGRPSEPSSPTRASAAGTLALLAVLEVEPSIAARGSSAAEIVVALTGLLSVRAEDEMSQERVATAPPDLPTERAAPESLPGLGAGGDDRPDDPAAVATGAGADERLPVDDERARRSPARTSWGGLLFLLHLIDGVALARRLADDPATEALSVRGLLHAVGVAVLARAVPDAAPVDGRDPAVLAFCGLAGDAEPPPLTSTDDERARAHARRAVVRETDAVIEQLRARLGSDDVAPPLPDTAVLLAVCRRRAIIDADPGWIDVVLELDEITTDVRRAGLDLDLGHLPWLGCVVRFRYG